MSNLDLKDVVLSLFPQGSAWELDEEGDLYKLIEGTGANQTTIYEFLRELAFLREPKRTPILEDLELEYGLLTNTSLTDAERRDYLHGVVYAPPSTGTAEYLEDQLQSAGFDVQVHANSPAADPAIAYGGAGGEMITNNIFYDRTIQEARKNQGLWSYVFFIGGDAIRASDGEILAIAPVTISAELKSLFRELVLKYKPLHSWCVAAINDADYFTFAPTDNAILDAPRGFADDEQTTGGYWWSNDFPTTYLYDDVTFEFIIDDVTGDYLLEE